jgi:hypothetical protein
MKALHIVIAIVFLLFAGVQYNDPDPLTWGTMYVFVGVIAGLAAFGKYYKWLTLIGLAVVVIWMFSLLPSFIHWIQMGMPSIVEHMKAESPHIEYTREFLGLVLAGSTLAFYYFQGRRQGA